MQYCTSQSDPSKLWNTCCIAYLFSINIVDFLFVPEFVQPSCNTYLINRPYIQYCFIIFNQEPPAAKTLLHGSSHRWIYFCWVLGFSLADKIFSAAAFFFCWAHFSAARVVIFKLHHLTGFQLEEEAKDILDTGFNFYGQS